MKKNKTLFFCLLSCTIVFIFYFHTLGYTWKNFDESIIYDESILPIPASFKEIFEIVNIYGLNNHFETGNPLYSNITNIRGTPLDVIFCLVVFWLFQKSAFNYHAFSLILHILNTCLCFLILNKISKKYFETHGYVSLLLITLLTLFWSLHPVNVESVLFATNFGALITYFLCLLLVFYFISLESKMPFVFLFLSYLFALFLNEYSVTLSFILFLYLYSLNISRNPNLKIKDALVISFKKTLPLFVAITVFFLYFLSLSVIRTTQESSLQVTLERIFWLSPQIFFHFLKLIFYPACLSIDQSSFVKLSNNLFHPYAIFCFFLMYFLIISTIISLCFIKKKAYFNFFILFFPFFLSLLPFLHIFSPLYNLSSERYLYLPLFFLIFGISHVLFSCRRDMPWHVSTLVILFVVVCIFGTRACMRTLDWKDSVSLLKSAIKTAPNYLYKGLREHMISNSMKTLEESCSEKETQEHTKKAITYLEKTFKSFKIEEEKHEEKTPKVVRFYGLDPKTLKAKTAFVISLCEFDLDGDHNKAYKIFSPYAHDIAVLDSLIIDFYYKILFNTKNVKDAGDILLRSLKQNKTNPVLFVALSDFYEYNYNDLKLTEEYLLKSFKYFPYDPLTLFGLKRFYQKTNNAEKFAYFSYLHGFRTHDLDSLTDSATVYRALNKKEEAKRAEDKTKKINLMSEQLFRKV